MLFAIECTDKAQSLQLRLDNRAAHLEYLSGLGDRLLFAGPFLDAEGNSNGSLLMVRAQTAQEAQQIADADPYAKAGLFQSSTIRAWKWTVNAPEGI